MKRAFDVGLVAFFPPIGRLFEYKVSDEIPVGVRVRARLGQKIRCGILVARTRSTVAMDKLRPIDEVIDSKPVINPSLLDLTMWTADYYQSSWDKALFLALPAVIRQGKPIRADELWYALESDTTPPDILKGKPKQSALLDFLRAHGVSGKPELDEHIPNWRPAMKHLAEQGLVSDRLPTPPPGKVTSLPELSPEQQEAFALVRPGQFNCCLLDGVTGSGKTEIYLHLAKQAVDSGKQVLMLVPEIGLVPDLLARTRAAFGHTHVFPYHSALSDGERARAWSAALMGQSVAVVGTRSATFMPLPNPGLITVDEEHDESYKEREIALHYHARDVAIKRAKALDCPVVLGSATPALETLWNVRRGRYRRYRLKQRYAEARLPEMEVIDVRNIKTDAGLSPRLLELMRSGLARDEQVLLFLNRRGYAPRLLCHACGAVPECPRCDLPLVWHKHDETLRCHHCQRYIPVPVSCAQCARQTLHPVGQGTERIEAFVRKAFPDVPVVRIDTDSVRRRNELEKRLRQPGQGGRCILIGTQIVAKGHHFPRVTLVGIIDVDQRLLATDFRAVERLGQLVVQVSGRAGRAVLPGRVALQTHYPDHPVLLKLLGEGYELFAQSLLEERKALALPPVRAVAVIRSSSRQPEMAMRFLESVYRQLRRPERQSHRVDVYPPMPAVLERIDNHYRARLLIMADNRNKLHGYLRAVRPKIENLKLSRHTRWSIDVDPLEIE